jgi:hypothetical protein
MRAAQRGQSVGLGRKVVSDHDWGRLLQDPRELVQDVETLVLG